jgi:ankyrin repeat protein
VTPLINAADSPRCSVEIMRMLLDHGADANACSPDGWTALMSASALGRVRMVTLLLNRGAHSDARNKLNFTALRSALTNRQGEVALVLIRHKIHRFLARIRCALLGQVAAYDDESTGLLGSSSGQDGTHGSSADGRNVQP